MSGYISKRTKELEKALRESREIDEETERVRSQFWDCLTPDEKKVLYHIVMDYFHGED